MVKVCRERMSVDADELLDNARLFRAKRSLLCIKWAACYEHTGACPIIWSEKNNYQNNNNK
jgi:hypothetical protein